MEQDFRKLTRFRQACTRQGVFVRKVSINKQTTYYQARSGGRICGFFIAKRNGWGTGFLTTEPRP